MSPGDALFARCAALALVFTLLPCAAAWRKDGWRQALKADTGPGFLFLPLGIVGSRGGGAIPIAAGFALGSGLLLGAIGAFESWRTRRPEFLPLAASLVSAALGAATLLRPAL